MRKSSPIRHIKPETICIGDVIRVTHKHKDVEKSVVGKVAKRDHYPRSTEYTTAEGVVLLEHFYATPQKVTVTLIQRNETLITLPGMEI